MKKINIDIHDLISDLHVKKDKHPLVGVQLIMYSDIHKDEFNKNGAFFGSLMYDDNEIIFYTSKWNSCHDYYQDITFHEMGMYHFNSYLIV